MKELLNAKTITAIGVPGVIALYLVYYLTTGVSDAHTLMQKKLERMDDYAYVNCLMFAELLKNDNYQNRCNSIKRGNGNGS